MNAQPKKKRVTIAQRKARAAYYIRNRTVTCEHCEDYPFLVEAHDALAQKNRHLKAKVKDLMHQLDKANESIYRLEQAMGVVD